MSTRFCSVAKTAILTSSALAFLSSARADDNLDAAINQSVQPLTDALSSFIFFSVVEQPDISDGLFSIEASILNDDNEIVAGQWTFTGTEIITHIVIKAGNEYAVYYFDDGLNSGMFDTSGVQNRGLVAHYRLRYSTCSAPCGSLVVWWWLDQFVGIKKTPLNLTIVLLKKPA